MKCKECNGVGYVKTISVGGVPCSTCNGTYEIEQTNEEWRKTCSTEDFAEWLEEKMKWAAQEQGTFTAKGWEMWLKQPHTSKE